MSALSVTRQGTRVAAIDQSRYLDALTREQPRYMRAAMLRYHDRATRDRGISSANSELREHVERYRGRIPANATDRDLKRIADQHAADTKRAIYARHEREPGADLMADYQIGHAACMSAGIEPARPNDPTDWHELRGCVRRMRCAYWWRAGVRRAFGRRVEQSARALGLVQRRRAYAVSDDGYERWRERTAANQQTLADCVAVRDDGTELSLADIAAAGTSNPRVRRAELMTRINGLEQAADTRGDVGIMVTMTVPAELHAYDNAGRVCDGQHVTPRDGQRWLRRIWANARAAINRRGLTVYGLRVAEPHADGTPHWHLLLFVPAAEVDQVDDLLRQYTIDGSTDENRIAHGYGCTRIDRSRGSATGYVAKYVCKSIDGAHLDAATTIGQDGRQAALDLDPGEAANRVRAWASQWSIRQFQFIGSPAVGVWRELRRIEPIDAYRQAQSDGLRAVERLRSAADAGQFGVFVDLMGGPGAPRNEQPARVRYVFEGRQGRYGDEIGRPFIEAYGRQVWTRPHVWTIEYRPEEADDSAGAAGAPWTRENNCTGTYERQEKNRSAVSRVDAAETDRAVNERADAKPGPIAQRAGRHARSDARYGASH